MEFGGCDDAGGGGGGCGEDDCVCCGVVSAVDDGSDGGGDDGGGGDGLGDVHHRNRCVQCSTPPSDTCCACLAQTLPLAPFSASTPSLSFCLYRFSARCSKKFLLLMSSWPAQLSQVAAS